MNLTFSQTLTATTCCQCHAMFAMESEAVANYKRTHGLFYCPYCRTGQHFAGESDLERAERLKREAEAATQRERQRHDQTKAELRETERRRRAEKAAKTRMKNRIKNGVCPCCNRHFTNLQRHMENQHPEFAKGEA